MTALLELRNLRKEYSGVAVVCDVNLSLESGKVRVLFGENGAGKSTLISMIAGVNTPSSGEMYFKGQQVQFSSVHEARNLGISAVFQEFSLIPQMTVEENLFLGAEITGFGGLKKSLLREKAEKLLQTLDFALDPRQPVHKLSRAEQQMVEIAKAFRSDLSLLILDEPTASLTQHETEQLFSLVQKLKEQGVGIIYITHRIAEIMRIADEITVLRDAELIDTVSAKTSSDKELVHLMTGRNIEQIFPSLSSSTGEPLFETDSFCTRDGLVDEVSISVRRGEIVGLAGLIGSGKSEFVRACFQGDSLKSGTLVLKGRKFGSENSWNAASMLKAGFMYLPSDRREEGLLMMRSVRENIALAALKKRPFSKNGILRKRAEITKTSELAKTLSLSPMNIERSVELFSGGNQQKVMFARCLSQNYDLIALDEPTVGVDVATRIIIYDFIVELSRQGVGILLISSDLPEILNLCHRVYVFYHGRVQGEFSGEQITEINILSHFFEMKEAVL